MASCLVCGKSNPPATLLCVKCGAPIMEEAPPELGTSPPDPGPRRRSKTPWIIAAVAVLAIAIVAGVYWWWSSSRNDPEQLVRDLPAGMGGVGGWNVRKMLDHQWFQKALDLPMVANGLGSIRSASGIDLMTLETVVGGFMVHEGEVHMLGIVKGDFNEERLWKLLEGLGTIDEQTIDGHRFARFEIPQQFLAGPFGDGGMDAFDPDDVDIEDIGGDEADSDEGEEPGRATIGEQPAVAEKTAGLPIPKVPPILVGVVDSSTLVYGSAFIIEKWLKGDETMADDEQMLALVDRVDSEAIAWGVGRFTLEQAAGWWSVIPMDKQAELAPILVGTNFLFQMRFDGDKVRVSLHADLPSESVASRLKSAWDELRDNILGDAGIGLALMGIEAPTVTTSGNEVEMTFAISLPALP